MASLDEYAKTRDIILKQNKEEREREEAKRQAAMREMGIIERPQKKQYCESPGSLENDEVTILYIVAMIFASFLHGNVFFWIILTIIWWKHIHRYD